MMRASALRARATAKRPARAFCTSSSRASGRSWACRARASSPLLASASTSTSSWRRQQAAQFQPSQAFVVHQQQAQGSGLHHRHGVLASCQGRRSSTRKCGPRPPGRRAMWPRCPAAGAGFRADGRGRCPAGGRGKAALRRQRVLHLQGPQRAAGLMRRMDAQAAALAARTNAMLDRVLAQAQQGKARQALGHQFGRQADVSCKRASSRLASRVR